MFTRVESTDIDTSDSVFSSFLRGARNVNCTSAHGFLRENNYFKIERVKGFPRGNLLNPPVMMTTSNTHAESSNPFSP